MTPKLMRLVLLLAPLLLLAGCGTGGQPSPTDGPQILSTLPEGWTPVELESPTLFNRTPTIWAPLNIDDDLTAEYLLFFTYDNGQVGAIVYDQQVGSTGVVSATPVSAPIQPAGFYLPYQVEPSYWTRSDVPDTVGFIALPGTDGTGLRIEQVQRYPDGDTTYPAGTANPQRGSSAPATDEAIVYGGSTVITVIWWRNAFNGYGVTQMAALGGLRADTQPEGDVLRPLQVVMGQTPLTDLLARSVLCRATRFTRAEANDPPDISEPVAQSAVRYAESDSGIVFCHGPPPHPYYPEGVVLAYLRPPTPPEPARGEQPVDPRTGLLWSGMDAAKRAEMDALLDLDGPDVPGSPELIVRDLRAPASVALPPDTRAPAGTPITTSVCAEVVSADGRLLRRLLFDLLYEGVQEVGETVQPERFVITNMTDITNAILNCTLVVP